MLPTSSCPLCAARVDPQSHRGAGRLWTFPPSVAVLGPRQYYTGYCLLISREYATEVSQMGLRPSPFPPPLALLAEAIKVCFQPLPRDGVPTAWQSGAASAEASLPPTAGTVRTVPRPSNRLGHKQKMIRPIGKRLEVGVSATAGMLQERATRMPLQQRLREQAPL
jgi:hypothetical protein